MKIFTGFGLLAGVFCVLYMQYAEVTGIYFQETGMWTYPVELWLFAMGSTLVNALGLVTAVYIDSTRRTSG